MTSNRSKRVIYAAIGANLAIAAMKFAAAGFTRSAAMMAEAIHSTLDTGNELLLLFGIKRSARPPDRLHPYGHGKALYFYSLLVAVYIFGLGGGLTIYRGITRIRHPQMPTHAAWSYAVLATAAVFEFASWWVSYRELRRRKDRAESVLEEIIGSKDPTVFIVFMEDSASLAGVFLAFCGIFLGNRFHNPYFDPAASVLIGMLLAVMAVLLGRETGALLLGERTNRKTIRQIRRILVADPAAEAVGEVRTMQLGPEEALLTVKVRFKRGMNVGKLESAIERMKESIRRKAPTIRIIFIEPDELDEKRSGKKRAA